MKKELTACPSLQFTREAIHLQLERIFRDAFFVNSDILRRFLSFIVDETLDGHSDWLKEYTIGINVLKKSADFKPQDNGIVRIHAGRLRRALNNYYGHLGLNDAIQISIPKGGYIPVFSENSQGKVLDTTGEERETAIDAIRPQQADTIAVLPFRFTHIDGLDDSLVDGLALQLSDALMRYDRYSVISYQSMRDVSRKINEISQLVSYMSLRYVITGDIQYFDKNIRFHVQMVELQNGRQLYSGMYEGRIHSGNIFKLQDEVVQFLMSELTAARLLFEKKSKRTSMAVVA
jgi:TolB-like protein